MLEGKIIPTCKDVTNCQKFYEDCLKGIVIEDDRNVQMIVSRKFYGEIAQVRIRVLPIKDMINASHP